MSVEPQETVVRPRASVDPDAGVQVTPTVGSTTSVAVATNDTAAPVAEVASCVKFAGSESTGGVVSTTVTPNCAVAVWPAPSVAEQATLVVPIAKVEPEAG